MTRQDKKVELQPDWAKMQINYSSLLIGMIATLVVSLSIHVVMLQVLHVPFPEFSGVALWASWLNTTCAIFAMMIVYGLASRRLTPRPMLTQCVIFFLLYVMLKETFRGILMNGVVTTGWKFGLLSSLPSLGYSFILMSLLVVLTPFLKTPRARALGAGIIAAFGLFAVRPALSKVFAPTLAAAQHLNHDEVYPFPYGWQVLAPAYLTYAEPVIACMLIAVLIWNGLSVKPVVRLGQFCVLILLIRGMLLPTFVYSFYSKQTLRTAMLSQSQFLLETLALALLTGIVVKMSFPAKLPEHR